ncbi:MAG TPA: ABC transporter permease subunit, partial [Polyangiaceae bacterium]|nr:ABC transporter permease subunit [Polyangiaceae bacterium]
MLWCAVSYVPFLWHPLVLVHDAGDKSVPGTYSYVDEGQRVEKAEFDARNRELKAAGKPLARGEPVNPIYFQAPHEVGRAFYTAFTTPPERDGDLWLHESLLQSIKVIFWGFFWSALFGIPLGVLCGTFSLFARGSEPFVDFVRYMPAPVFGALAVTIFGLGDEPKVAIIFIGTFFQMVLVVANTTRSVDVSLMHAAQTLGANYRQLIFNVVVPGALPALYRDMRILLGWAWTYLIVAEYIGASSGITYFINQQAKYRIYDSVFAAIIMIGIMGFTTDRILDWIGRQIFPWQKTAKPGLMRSIAIARR